MNNYKNILSDWTNEIFLSLEKINNVYIAIFSIDKKIVFSSSAFHSFINTKGTDCLINPDFDQILLLGDHNGMIFEGLATIGSYDSLNTSLTAKIFKKNNLFLFIGAENTAELKEKNNSMLILTEEICNLQRQIISEKQKLQNTLSILEQKNEELKRLNEDKTFLMSIIAHDLRNPFNALLGYTELALSQKKEEKIFEYLEIIKKVAANTFNLFEDLLLWLKSDAGKIVFNPEKIEFLSICKEAIDNIKYLSLSKKILFSYGAKENIILLADKNMTMTILRNLIINAIKYSKTGGEIEISAERKENHALISIKDNGIGMSEENLKKLWDKDNVFTLPGIANEKGTGFGLLLCKTLIEKHNGSIWVQSQIGKGTTFYFTLPIATHI